MNQAITFLKELQHNPEAKNLTANIKIPENEAEAVRAYVALAEKLGYNLTAEEIQAGAKTLAEEQRRKTKQAVSDVEKAPLSEEALETVAGGDKGDYYGNTCASSYTEGEWCWFSDSCSMLINDMSFEPSPYNIDELHNPGSFDQDIQNTLYGASDEEIRNFMYGDQ